MTKMMVITTRVAATIMNTKQARGSNYGDVDADFWNAGHGEDNENGLGGIRRRVHDYKVDLVCMIRSTTNDFRFKTDGSAAHLP